jgi:hypothetical protein
MRHFETLLIAPRFLVCVAALLLGGCVDTAVDLGASRNASAALVARPGVSPRGASVAVTSLEGAPDAVAARFKDQFASASEARDIALVAPETANYRLRGYLTATPGQGGSRLAYVWDIFDSKGRRAQRLADDVALKANADPWAGLDEKTSLEIVARAADNLAAFLSNTPEAIAAAGGDGAGLSIVAAQRAPAVSAKPAPALGFAETQ